MTKLILHDIRSIYNVGSILRTADGFNVEHVYMTGRTPYPSGTDEQRLPHVAARVEKQLHKTALGAEHSVPSTPADINQLLPALKTEGFMVVAVEQTPEAIDITAFQPPKSVTLVLGNEVEGLPDKIIKQCDHAVQIPMLGTKRSFNVSVAAAIALYALDINRRNRYCNQNAHGTL